jgi:hypothetical protein
MKVLHCAMASSYFEVSDITSHCKTCTPCFHSTRTSFPDPECCSDLYGACDDGVIGAGKPKMWPRKQWVNCHKRPGVYLVPLPETKRIEVY